MNSKVNTKCTMNIHEQKGEYKNVMNIHKTIKCIHQGTRFKRREEGKWMECSQLSDKK